MSDETQGDWLNRERQGFGSFDLSSLNLPGWLLFLSTLIPLAVHSSGRANAGGGDFESRAEKKLYAVLVLVVMVGWFQFGKILLRRLVVSIYRECRSSRDSGTPFEIPAIGWRKM